MNTYSVYHLKVPKEFELMPEAVKVLYFDLTWKPTKDLVTRVWSNTTCLNYQKVADVKAENMNQVFQLTNHIDWDWTTNEGVEECNPMTGKRSTSVGDLIAVNGKVFIVDNHGFKEI